MTEYITIGGKEYGMRASALVPRLYRASTGRDVYGDLTKLKASLESVQKKKKSDFDVVDLEIFENLAWAMCRAADRETTPETVEEWLDGIEGVFSIYEALPKLLAIWSKGEKQTSVPAKK